MFTLAAELPLRKHTDSPTVAVTTLQHIAELLRETPFVGVPQTVNQMKSSVKEPNKFHIYETEKITRKASDAAEYMELFGSFTRDRHARRI